MDISDLKQQARTLEQQGNASEALAMYRLMLAEVEAIGGIRQELPLLIKIGDLELKAGNVDGAVEMYERAAGEYAEQGAAQPVMSLCGKIVRADPQAVGAYLRLARRLLDNGFTDGARDVLIDYAQRAKLEKTRDGLERLAGLPEEEVKRVLAKAIDSTEGRIPQRVPRAARPAPGAPPPAEEPEGSPPEPPGKRVTVPVGALDAEPEPDLLQQRPPEPRPESKIEALFPKPEDLQAPVLPDAPSPPAGPALAPPLPGPGAVPPRPTSAPVAPPPPAPGAAPPLPPLPGGPPQPGRVETTGPPPEAPPPLTPTASPSPPLRASQQLVFEPSVEPPARPPAPPPSTAAPEPRPEERVSGRPSRPSRLEPRPPQLAATPSRPAREAPRVLWAMFAVLLVVGGVGALVWFNVIPLDRLRDLLPKREPVTAPPQRAQRPEPAPDTVMARDTAGAPPITTPAPVEAGRPAGPAPAPPTLPPGAVLSGAVYVVLGYPVESLQEISPENRLGFRIAQVLDSGQRIILEEFPAETTGAEGEIGLTGLPGDTVVAHVRMGGLDITLKGVIPEAVAVDLLQRLVQVRPQ